MIRNKREFVDYFESYIRPKYKGDLEKIAATNEKVKQFRPIAIAGGLFFFFLLAVCNIFFGPIGVFVGFFGFIGLLILYGRTKAKFIKTEGKEPNIIISNYAAYADFQVSSKQAILEEIIPAVLPNFAYGPSKGITEKELKDTSFFSDTILDIAKTDDAIIGSFNDKEVRVSEVSVYTVKEDEDSRRVIKFLDSLVVEVDMKLDPNVEMYLTYKTYNNDSFKASNQKSLHEISLSNLYVDQHYRVLTNDSIVTNKLLQPRNIDKLVQLMEKTNKYISLGVKNGKIMLVVKSDRDLFEIFTPENFNPDVIWEEILIILDTISYVEQIGLDFKKAQ